MEPLSGLIGQPVEELDLKRQDVIQHGSRQRGERGRALDTSACRTVKQSVAAGTQQLDLAVEQPPAVDRESQENLSLLAQAAGGSGIMPPAVNAIQNRGDVCLNHG